MRLAVSNIAWTDAEEEEVADKLLELGVKYVEIAPTKLWEDPTSVSDKDAREYVQWWADRGITVVAFQSMLFSRPDLKLFESEENRHRTIDYLKEFIRLARVMNVKKLVFGSPKNRQRGDLPLNAAKTIAKAFFSELGEYAQKNGVVLCLEPNATQYNCDFITTAKDGDELVREVSSAGFGLHLDTACMQLAGDPIEGAIRSSADILQHYHISAPMLGEVSEDTDIDHASAAKALREIEYEGFVSIEMRPGDAGENVDRLEKAVRFAQAVYTEV